MAKVINTLSLYKFFDDFIVAYPLYAVMFADNGLSLAQISTLFFAWSFTAFILEIPSGVLADKYDRKSILILGQIIRIIGFCIWLLFPTFWGFLIGFIFCGIKSAFTSGTFEAYIYDYLKSKNSDSQFAKYFGKIKSFSFLAILLSAIGASVLPQGNYLVVLIVSISALIISTIAAIYLPRAEKIKSTGETRYFKLLKKGLNSVIRKKELMMALAFLSIVVGFMAVDEYLSLYAVNVGLSPKFLGILLAIYATVQALASLFAHRVKPVKGIISYIILLIFGTLLLVLGLMTNILGLIVWLLLATVSAYIIVIGEQNLQDAADSEVRATVSSVKGFSAELLSLSVFVFFSTSSDSGLFRGMALLGIVVISISVLLILWKLKTKL